MSSIALMDDDQILLPNLINKIANTNPEKLYCAFVKSPHVNDGVREVTYGDFANAINRFAWWLEKKFGKGKDFPTLAYVGSTDIRYALVTLAAAKTGHQAMLLSPANSIAAQLNLLEATRCKVLLTAVDFLPFAPATSAILGRREMEHASVESVEYWLASEKVPEYPFIATLDDNIHRPFVILHTSGSTGMPEPITWTFSAVAVYRRLLFAKEMVSNAPKTMVDIWKDNCLYMAFPPFHAVGIINLTTLCVYWNMPSILGPANILSSAELASKIINLDICTAAVLSPAVLQEMAKNPTQLHGLQKLNYLSWCGATLPAPVIDKIKSHVSIYCAYGATETGLHALTVEENEHPEWMNFYPLTGASFRHISEDLYELVFVRDPKVESIQVVFNNFPELSEWATKDMFSKHPTKDLWKYRGRRDDLIVMANALNINPIMIEGAVMSNPQVVGALLVGTGRVKSAWLIEVKEPPESDSDRARLIDDIWPTIEKASEDAPAQARVSKDAIVFTTRQKPMLRAPKGSVQRKLTLQAYQAELDAVFGESG